ncbi:TIGR02611 family protein [Longispora albida]|uniref:TIGR02611 family protein n=1 Tax=Longispora albida TaxID=203523 RepID=UPI00037629DF|nr:TIGR02611 family protein [Longispora albida]
MESGANSEVKESQRHTGQHWLDRVRAAPGGRIAVKITVTVLGVATIALGAFLIPLPGPGWLIVLAGLAILAIEFHWARRLLTFTRRHLHNWTEWIKRQSLLVRALIGIVGLVFVSFVVWASVKYSLDIDLWDKAMGFVRK